MTIRVFAIEGSWSSRPDESRTVLPALDILRRTLKVEYIHKTAATKEEFLTHLRQAKRISKKYDVLYIAAHGKCQQDGPYLSFTKRNQKNIGNEMLSLLDIAALEGGAFHGKIVFFSSCEIFFQKKFILDFRKKTGCKTLIGYGKEVDWVDSLILDLAILSEVARHWKSFIKKKKSAIDQSISYVKRYYRGKFRELSVEVI